MRSMYDVQVYSRYNDVYEEENLPQDSYEIITEFLTEHKIDTVYDCTFNLYLSENDDFHKMCIRDRYGTVKEVYPMNTILKLEHIQKYYGNEAVSYTHLLSKLCFYNMHPYCHIIIHIIG